MLKKLALFFLVIGVAHVALSYVLDLRFSYVAWITGRLKGKPDILYLGDSVVYTTRKTDKGKATLDSMLARELCERKVVSLASDAFNPEVFEAICRYMQYKALKPGTVIIPINLRSFSPSWEDRFVWQFSEEVRLLKNPFLYHLYVKPLKIFKYDRDLIEQDVLESAPVFDGTRKIGTFNSLVAQLIQPQTDENSGLPPDSVQAEELRKNCVVFHYLYTLEQNNKRFNALLNTSELLRQMGARGVYYITPINYELCKSYYGEAFRGRVERNIETIQRGLSARGEKVLDLAFALGAEHFDGKPLFLNEHLDESGRQYVADRLAAFIAGNGY